MTFKVIETFSGIGAQRKAFAKIHEKNLHLMYEIVATVEWEIGAMYAYDLIHHGKQELSKYAHLTKEELLILLERYTLSSDGKEALTLGALKRMPVEQLKAIFHSIEKNKNLVDISSVHAKDLPEADFLTYSFPCQDLSVSSSWHGNFTGISKEANNRSGLLWEIERILKEYKEEKKEMPRFLLMENVTAIHSSLHDDNFNLWKKELQALGYRSRNLDLDARYFGILQRRIRTFMLSVFEEDLNHLQKNMVRAFFEEWENSYFAREWERELVRMDDFLRLDYTNETYRNEARISTPNNTTVRQRIHKDSILLAKGKKTTGEIARTITTKQDRYPNAGIIEYEDDFGEEKSKYRNLTARETFLLQGFEEADYQRLVDNNLQVTKSRFLLSHSKLLKLAGNSIVVNILEDIFMRVFELNNQLQGASEMIPFPEKKKRFG